MTPMVSLAAICHQSYYNTTNYIPYAMITFLERLYHLTGSLYILISTYFTPPLSPPTSGNHQFVSCIYELVSVWFVRSFVLFFRFRV